MKKIYLLCSIIAVAILAYTLSNEVDLNKSTVQDLSLEQLQDQITSYNNDKVINYYDSLYQFKSTDVVEVVIQLNSTSLFDVYSNKITSLSMSEYSLTTEAQNLRESIIKEQSSFIDTLNEGGISVLQTSSYQTLLNGISVKTQYSNISKIEALSNVSNVAISEVYNIPETSIYYSDDMYVADTGIYDTSSLDYRGEGMLVAVLDSGYQLGHDAFEKELESTTKYDKNEIAELFSTTVASLDNNAYTVDNFYYNSRVIFKYDYADCNSDVRSYTSDHGQHVAGIVAGDDDVITGAAPNAQLALMKVFSDGYGASTSDILKALEDCLILDVDVVNMSLGTPGGFSSAHDDELSNDLYSKLISNGISMTVSAGNNYSSGLWGENGNTTSTDNPDSGIVGSPGAYTGNTTVASADTISNNYILGNGVSMTAYNYTNDSSEYYDFIEMANATDSEVTFEYVAIPGYGESTDYEGINVEGKFALVSRGETNFSNKVLQAQNNGAAGVIIYNNATGIIYATVGNDLTIPGFTISQADGELLAAQVTGTIKISSEYMNAPLMSSFSSWGPLPSLEFEPDITGPGGDIYSSVIDGYAYMSGTSMSSPNIAGLTAVARQYVEATFTDLNKKEVADMVSQIMMSTTTILNDADGLPYSVRKQGAGLADIFAFVSTEAYLSVKGQSQTKIELYDDYERTGVFSFEFELNNFGSSSITYNLSALVMTETASDSVNDLGNYYILEQAYMLNSAVTYSGTGVSGNTVTVSGNSTTTIKVVITMTEADKNYIDETFANGMFVEGFVKLTSEDKQDLNIAYLGFYGDWRNLPIFDATVYDDDYADMYESFMVGGIDSDFTIVLGEFMYDYDQSVYGDLGYDLDRIALGYEEGTINNIYAVFVGLLRGCESVDISIIDSVTGEVVYMESTYNCRKTFLLTSYLQMYPFYGLFDFYPSDYGLSNNAEYEILMSANLDYYRDSEAADTLSWKFTVDFEAPTVLNDEFYVKDGRVYLDVVVSDNQYAQAIHPAVMVNGSLSYLSSYATPVLNEKGLETIVTIDVTNYISSIISSNNQLILEVDDYALNSTLYTCEFDSSILSDISLVSDTLLISPNQEVSISDLIENYTMNSGNVSVYSDNSNVCLVTSGVLMATNSGNCTITITNTLTNTTLELIVTVLSEDDEGFEDIEINYSSIVYFETIKNNSNYLYATSIGDVGDMYAIYNGGSITMNPGEQINIGALMINPSYVNCTVSTSLYYGEGVITLSNNTITAVRGEDWDAVFVDVMVGDDIIYQMYFYVDVTSEFYIYDTTLVRYLGNSTVVSVPDGITEIGTMAFGALDENFDFMDSNITTVILPESVNLINMFAFAACSSLTSINLDNIDYFGSFAFYYCYNLTTVGNLNAGYYDQACFALTSIDQDLVIPANSNVTIGDMAFYGASALGGLVTYQPNIKSLTIGDNSTVTIGESAFEGLSSSTHLTKVSFGNNLNLTIKDYAFKDCNYLANNNSTTLTFPDNSNITIGEYAFQRINTNTAWIGTTRRGTTKLIFGSNSTYNIGENAFINSSYIQTLTFGSGSTYNIGASAFASGEYTSVALGDSTYTIGRNAFRSSLSTITIGANTNLVDCDAQICSNSSLTITNNSSNYVLVDNVLYSSDYSEFIFARSNVLTASSGLILDSRVTSISDGKFAGLGITSISFGDDSVLQTIGNGAFLGCTSLTSINIPSSVNSIGEYAFLGCTKLSSVNLSGISTIMEGAFMSCTSLTTVVLGDSDIVIEDSAFEGCSKLSIINLDNVTSFGDYSFYNTAITELNLNDVVVGEGAFMYTKSLDEVNVLGDVTLGVGAFYGSSVYEVNIAEGSTVNLSMLTFAYTNLVTFDLTAVNGIVPSGAFMECRYLTDCDLSELLFVGEMAFANTLIDEINLENVLYVLDKAFIGTTSDEIILNPNVIYIAENAFMLVTGFSTFTSNNQTTITLGNYFIEDGVLYRIDSNGYSLLSYPTNKEDTVYRVLEGTTFVASYAMANNDFIKEVFFPMSLLVLEDFVLANCSSLWHVGFTSIYAPTLRGSYNTSFEYETVDGELTSRMKSLYNENYNSIYYYSQFKNYVGYENNLTMTFPQNGINYDSFIYSVYFDYYFLGDVTPDELTIKITDMIIALPAVIEIEHKSVLEEVKALYETVEDSSQMSFLAPFMEYVEVLDKTIAFMEAVEAIPTVITIDDKDLVELARELYSLITDETQISNVASYLEVLEVAESMIEIKQLTFDVETLINELPSNITLDAKAAVEAARALYDTVTDSTEIELLSDALVILEAAESMIEIKQLTFDVETLINNLSIEITLDDESAVKSARALYNTVTNSAEIELLVETLAILEAAEARIQTLELTAAVIASINSISVTVTLEDKAIVEAARALYNSVTDADELDKIASYLVVLENAEIIIVTKQLTVDVEILINALPSEISLIDKEDIQAARALYDTVTDSTEIELLSESLAILEAAELALVELESKGSTSTAVVVIVASTSTLSILGVAALVLKKKLF